MSCLINVEQGTLQGKVCETFYQKKYYSFEGMPYAKPPVGNLRFKNPQPPEPWEGILDATKPGNKCIQANPYSTGTLDGSEDCLYLNIYTPSLPSEKKESLPVFFYVHGGRLIFGHGNYYTPDYLLKQDVILVTLNYRLHVLGWLCLDIPECTGNMGLKDTVLALKWVHKNIDKFNGDPSNLTVGGESAGGAMISSFITSEMTEGLFSKMIALSGACISDLYMVDEDPIEKASQIADVIGFKSQDKYELHDFFLKATIEDLIMAFSVCELGRESTTINAFLLPVVEKKFEGIEQFFSIHPRVAIAENKFVKVPLIITYNSHESALFFKGPNGIQYETDFTKFIPQYANVTDKKTKAKMADAIRHFYFKNKEINDSTKHEYVRLISDAYFIKDLMIFPETMSKFWDQIYFLKFSYFGNMHTRVMKSIDIKGATHGDMIQYQFYRKNKAAQCTEKDKEIVEFLSESFCNFMKNGIPTWRNQKTKWLPYTKENRYTLNVGDDITLEKDLDREYLLFWTELQKAHCKL